MATNPTAESREQERQALIAGLAAAIHGQVCRNPIIEGSDCADPENDLHPEDWCHICLHRAALAALQSSPSREEREQALQKAERAGASWAHVWPSPAPSAIADMAEARRLLKLDPTPTEER